MIELLLTASIVWITNTTQVPCTFESGYPHACYWEQNNTIYISKQITNAPKDFALYHEIGHSLYKTNFPTNLFKTDDFENPDYEVLANDFGWWIYSKKHPQEKWLQRIAILKKDKFAYFETTCQKKCVEQILLSKIK